MHKAAGIEYTDDGMSEKNQMMRRRYIELNKLKSKAVIFSILVYLVWEITGIAISFGIQILIPGVYELSYGSYMVMFLNEMLTFGIIFLLFCRKQNYYHAEKQSLSFFVFLPVLIQIGSDVATLVNGKIVLNLFSLDGVKFLCLCFIGTMSIALLEELVWRHIIFGNMIYQWSGRKNGVLSAVVVSSLLFGLSHYMNAFTGGQEFAATSIQVIQAACAGVFLAAVYYRTSNLLYPILVHGLCDFSNFFMNEMLGYDYELLKCDRMIRILFTVLYLFIGIYMMRSSNTSQKEEI